MLYALKRSMHLWISASSKTLASWVEVFPHISRPNPKALLFCCFSLKTPVICMVVKLFYKYFSYRHLCIVYVCFTVCKLPYLPHTTYNYLSPKPSNWQPNSRGMYTGAIWAGWQANWMLNKLLFIFCHYINNNKHIKKDFY